MKGPVSTEAPSDAGLHRISVWRWWKRAAVLLASLVALTLVGELGLRLGVRDAFFSPPVFQRTNGPLGYALLPSVTSTVIQFGRAISVGIDSEGNRRTPGAQKAAPVRLHLVGDSQVFGWGLSDNETIGERLQQRLGPKVLVINQGVPGYGPDEYLEVFKQLPSEDLVVVIHTEENDAADAYKIFRQNTAACTYMVSFTERESPLRCALMNSRLIQVSFVWWNQVQHRYNMTPLGFSDHSQVAAEVLHGRVKDSYSKELERRGDRLIFTVVPWKGRYSASWLTRYSPPPRADLASIATPFSDEVRMVERFRKSTTPAALYLEDDTHLSPAGADLVAEAMTSVVELVLSRASNVRME